MTDGERILEMRGIDKTFPGVHALRSVDLDVRAGEILGLVGENGAGKSTLIKILAGAYARDAGEIRIAGELVEASSPNEMIQRGVAVIYQEPALAPHLSVAENIFMGRLPTSRFGIVDRRRLAEDTAVIARRLDLDIQPGAKVSTLSVARRQMVEIARALSRKARLIVLDEPSAVLADAELDGLIRVMHRLAETGVAFIYISHRLNEVFRITDQVTVMKDGQVVVTEPTATLTPDRLVRLMVGRDLGAIYGERGGAVDGAVALAVRGLRRDGVFVHVDLTVRSGEILGIAGLAGSGRTEVLRAIHGADPIDGGTVEVFGRAESIRSPREAIALGIGLLTEDRKADGLLLHQAVATNVTISRMDDVAPGGVVRAARERNVVDEHVRRLTIRTPSQRTLVQNLSGGNQQKVIFAKWLHARCRILLIDEPTRGVDVGAKREIYLLLRDLAARGTAIVMVSSELPEVLGMSDRIVVMREGRIVATLDAAEATEERIMAHATRVAA
ncbi:MAG TPA: sugar ABC transporter ATP-binding protein [Candidatus Limnocylindrales bacterium]|jgi:ribose transport system ATP-binding protein|nr:sugar ABC transporter ATP-binding protein [Candidatus Limnocylindrales bacterium]